jgi:histone-lysine N-methyltransferase SETMAR
VFLKIDRIEYRAVIKFFVKEGLTPNEIRSNFIKFYGDSSPSFSTVKKWAAEFKRGRTGLENDPREGRSKSATTPEIIEQWHDMVLDDRQMKVREIARTCSTHTIIIVGLITQCYKFGRCLLRE